MQLDSPAVREAVQALARHVLPASGIALLLLLCTVWGVWRLVQRYGVYRETSRFAPLAYLVAYLALGFGLIIGAAAVFAGTALATALWAVRRLGAGDRRQCGAEPGAEKHFQTRPPVA